MSRKSEEGKKEGRKEGRKKGRNEGNGAKVRRKENDGRKEQTDHFQNVIAHVVPAAHVEGQGMVLVVLHQLPRARGKDDRGGMGGGNQVKEGSKWREGSKGS